MSEQPPIHYALSHANLILKGRKSPQILARNMMRVLADCNMPVDSISILRRIIGPHEITDLVQVLHGGGPYFPLTEYVLPTDHTTSGLAMIEGKIRIVANTAKGTDNYLPPSNVPPGSEIAYPVVDDEGESLGVVYLRRDEINGFDEKTDKDKLEQILGQRREPLLTTFEIMKGSYDSIAQTAHSREYGLQRMHDKYQSSQNDDVPFTLATIDLDHFSDLNEKYGHPHTDAILFWTAEMMRRGVRKRGDIFMRDHGDEFLIGMPNITPEDAQKRLQAMQEHLRTIGTSTSLRELINASTRQTYGARHYKLPEDLRVTFSIGIAGLGRADHGVQEFQQLIDHSEHAAKEAKRTRDCALIYKQ